jgi:hypothetical protein
MFLIYNINIKEILLISSNSAIIITEIKYNSFYQHH